MESASDAAALNFYLSPLQKFIDDSDINEICVNEPGIVFTQGRQGKVRNEVPVLNFNHCMQLATLMATFSNQHITEKDPVLSVTLPGGQRCQVVIPPVTLPGTVSFTIRNPSSVHIDIKQYESDGAFEFVVEGTKTLLPYQIELMKLKNERRYREFIELAVKSHQNILISGATGSGKTTFAKALIDIVPETERLISIENVDELRLRNTHQDSVALFYSAGGQGLSNATPEVLMKSCLRQKPDRVFLAELISADEAFYFLDTVSSGHPGSISTMHSDTPALCIERLISLIRRSKDAGGMGTEDIRKMIFMCIDVIIQFKVVNNRRCVTEIYYEPEYKNKFTN